MKRRKITLAGVSVAVVFCSLSVVGASVKFPLERARIGEIKPEGWLMDRARAARDGYTGHMDDVGIHFRRAWSADWKPRGRQLDWLDDEKGSWGSEGGTYWFDGLVHLAWQMDDPMLKELAKKKLEPMLSGMHENAVGFMWWMDARDPKQINEFMTDGSWQMRWLLGMRVKVLKAYWETTGDVRAKNAIKWAMSNKTLAAFDKTLSATLVGGLVTAWETTGDEQIRECIDLALDKFAKTSPYVKQPEPWLPETLWLRRRAQWALKVPTRHGVITSEHLFSAWQAWRMTGDKKFRDAVLSWYAFFDKYCRQPYGVTAMDEEWGWAGAKRGTETCDVAAEMFTKSHILQGTGSGKWGDDLERAQFNAAPACVSRDFKRHCYYQLPNRAGYSGEAAKASLPIDRFCEYRESKQWPLCCVAALNKILPNYIQSMWMKTSDGGIAVTAYGPSRFETELKCGRVAFVEKTSYPFSETIEISVEDTPKAAFPLLARMPAWCKNPMVTVNGQKVVSKYKDGFARIEREWKKGDVLKLVFPMKPRVEIVRDMNDNARRLAYVSYGPLLMAYAYPVKDDNTIIGNAAEPVLDPGSIAAARIVRSAMPKVWDWPLNSPLKMIVKDATGRPLELIPYGCTKLRVSMFPVEGMRNPVCQIEKTLCK